VAKRSRQRPGSGEMRQAHPTGAGDADTRAASTSRPTTRRTRTVRRQREEGFLERHRGLITLAVAAAGVLLIGFLFFQSSARGGYECDTLLQPGPTDPPPAAAPTGAATPGATAGATASPEATPNGSPATDTSPQPGASPTAEPSPPAPPTPRVGFTTTELGRDHLRDPSQRLRFAFCPPTSGDHFNVAGVGPIRGQFYPPAQEQSPGGWIHNLEHGYVVALYRCPTGDDCASDAELAELQRFFNEAPDSPVATQCPRKVLVARFDEMETRFAFLAWNRALLMDELDLDTAFTFAEQWIDHEAVPERGICG
jgi:hypothetical protein